MCLTTGDMVKQQPECLSVKWVCVTVAQIFKTYQCGVKQMLLLLWKQTRLLCPPVSQLKQMTTCFIVGLHKHINRLTTCNGIDCMRQSTTALIHSLSMCLSALNFCLMASICPLWNRYMATIGLFLYPEKISTRYSCVKFLPCAHFYFVCVHAWIK